MKKPVILKLKTYKRSHYSLLLDEVAKEFELTPEDRSSKAVMLGHGCFIPMTQDLSEGVLYLNPRKKKSISRNLNTRRKYLVLARILDDDGVLSFNTLMQAFYCMYRLRRNGYESDISIWQSGDAEQRKFWLSRKVEHRK